MLTVKALDENGPWALPASDSYWQSCVPRQLFSSLCLMITVPSRVFSFVSQKELAMEFKVQMLNAG